MEYFNITPGKEIGLLKESVKKAILDGEIENGYDAAFEYMKVKAAELGLVPRVSE